MKTGGGGGDVVVSIRQGLLTAGASLTMAAAQSRATANPADRTDRHPAANLNLAYMQMLI